MLYKIWDNKLKYYCLTLYSREQAEIMIEHFIETDNNINGVRMKNRYRIDEVRA